MNRFAQLLDRLSYQPARNGKLRLMTDYLRHTPDPERGYALAALTGALSFRHAKPALIRDLVAERVDPVLFALSYDFVGDLSETAALIWQADENVPGSNHPPLLLSEVVDGLARAGRNDLRKLLAGWLDALDETGRWALLKLITGALRVGVSARLARTAVADLGGVEVDAVEQVWHGLAPPYLPLFAWLEGRGERPSAIDPAPFRPAMLAQPLDEKDFDKLDPREFRAEWKWDGIRLQVSAGRDERGHRMLRLYSRTGEEVTPAFPDLADALGAIEANDFALDGELLVLREKRVQSFATLQQRLNRKTVTAKLAAEFPAHLRAYDIIAFDGEDLRALPFVERRARLEGFVKEACCPRLDISPLVDFEDWPSLAHARENPAEAGAGDDGAAVEGVMLKRRDSIYVAGRPTGPWFKWKRDPFNIDAVLMYAQRGHGKRSSFYSDYTFGVWRAGAEGDELVPVGKAYFGFTDEELARIDRYVRNNTIDRFGPVRVVEHGAEKGLVFEIAFEGLNRSTRHKSGVAMRFPRIARIRWDKPPREADRIETLELLLKEG
ncbi:MAG: cisplatin damage response ATP-dependent DNA ligase [Methylobacteriaceae bacterium]|nr:cisplatin damage response ATP-dependent DNA ligase [Methylobacteriaceae bacterium]